ncbi:MAG: phosphoribosyltransferase, partial [Gallionellaceae bacterium]
SKRLLQTDRFKTRLKKPDSPPGVQTHFCIGKYFIAGHVMNIRSRMECALPAQPCLLCGAASRDGVWCGACDTALPYLSAARCPVCALPTPDGSTCGRCLKRPPQFDRTVAVFAYAFPVDKLVQALKFGEQLLLAPQLAGRLAQRIETRPDCIVAMPLHPARLRERGCVRDPPPQSALPWKERGRNMRKAFACTGDLSGKHVAVVDDVMTSGASINELAEALRQAGAREVSAWVVARTLPHAG